MKIRLLLIAALFAVTQIGCTSYYEYIKESNDKKERERIKLANEACVKYGFKKSTNSFSQCIQNEVNQMKNREAISSAASKSTRTKTECKKTLTGGLDCTTR